MFKRFLALFSILVLVFALSGCQMGETNDITVDKFCDMAQGLWVNLQKTDNGYECINIVNEDGSWRYKYLVYEVACAYNMEISEVKMANGTYKLTLYSHGKYNEIFDTYDDKEYKYVDVKIVDNTIIVDGTRKYTYFSDYSELDNMLGTQFGNDDGIPDLPIRGEYLGLEAGSFMSYFNGPSESYGNIAMQVFDLKNTYNIDFYAHITSASNEMIGVVDNRISFFGDYGTNVRSMYVKELLGNDNLSVDPLTFNSKDGNTVFYVWGIDNGYLVCEVTLNPFGESAWYNNPLISVVQTDRLDIYPFDW